MQLNNTTQYAIRILNYMANEKEQTLFSAKQISEILNISYKFLTKIMTDLVKSGLINSIRGREGGYKLAKSPADIKLIEILTICNEPISEESCILGIGACDNENKCALHDQWVTPKSLIRTMFEETSLENLEGCGFKI